MRVYKNTNVFEEALSRIHRIYDEFDNVIVGFSGGKDSTCVLELAIMVAKEKGRLPVPVLFVDQEAEWQATIDYVEEVMYREYIKPYWLQVPFKITNSSSGQKDYLMAWGDNEKWMRDRNPIAETKNVYDTARGTSHLNEFYAFFPRFLEYHYPNQKAAYLSGVRAEESPTRAMALTTSKTYKDITWGKILNNSVGHYTFYPLYDWSYKDIWKAIHSNNWNYNKIYDSMYQYGVPVMKMRVSNLNHEESMPQLFYLQEVERETYNKMTERLQGVSTAGKLGKDDFFVHELPYMFNNWKEYRDFLLTKIVPEENIPIFKKKFNKLDIKYERCPYKEDLYRVLVNTLVLNDFGFVKLKTWESNPRIGGWRKIKKKVIESENINKNV